MGLSSEEIDKVDGLYHPLQIDLVLNHNLSRNLFIESQCFKDEKTAEAAHNYIISADSNSDKIIRAEEVKRLTNPEMVDLLNRFGLEPQKIKESAYFSREQMDPNLRPKVLESLNSCYENEAGDISAKKKAASTVFNSIYKLNNSNQITAIIDYKLNPNLVKRAKCFKWEGKEAALKWIKQAYNDPRLSSMTEKKQAAKNIFMLIKDIYDMEAIDQISTHLTRSSSVAIDSSDTAKIPSVSPRKKALPEITRGFNSK